MKSEKFFSVIRRNRAEEYILTSLISFAATVIVTRAFLEITGYPQIGNNVLHIAHALWGGLFLIVSAYLPLAYANRRALQASAVLSGLGIGLFIDEVGKFVTHANDYFFPPALPLIYSFVLLNVLVYLYFRRPPREHPRAALYNALEGLHDLLDGDLDPLEQDRIRAQLAITRQSNRTEIVNLANTINDYLRSEQGHLVAPSPGVWKRGTLWVKSLGLRFGRRRHRTIISIVLVGWVILVVGYLVQITRRGLDLDPQVLELRGLLIAIQASVGVFMIAAAIFWFLHNEKLSLKLGVSGFLISLVALQLFYFYISQFSAITATLLQLALLQVLLSYRRWYLDAS